VSRFPLSILRRLAQFNKDTSLDRVLFTVSDKQAISPERRNPSGLLLKDHEQVCARGHFICGRGIRTGTARCVPVVMAMDTACADSA
jgi:hypothetical protein